MNNFNFYINHILALRERWRGHEEDLMEFIKLIRKDPEWHKSDSYKQLMNSLPNEGIIDFMKVEKDLRGAPLSKINLGDDSTNYAHLSRVDLSYSDLSNANLSGADLSGANLYFANLYKADLFNAKLTNSDLSWANLKEANLERADLSQSSLVKADLSGANFFSANLSGANLLGVKYTKDEIFDRLVKWWIPKILTHIPLFKNLKPVGITNFLFVDTTKIIGYQNPILKRYIEDIQFIEGFKEKSRFIYLLWKITSDCGRSLLLWCFWCVVIIILFSSIYYAHSNWFYPYNLKFFDILYFTMITFTTFGFGDIHAKIGNHIGQALVMANVIIGYIMLGGLISIFANKLARRS